MSGQAAQTKARRSVGLLGKKLGMTRVYNEAGVAVPVTVIEVGGNWVLQQKTSERDGYTAVQVGFDDQKPARVSRPQLGHFAQTKATPKRFIREFRCEEGEELPEVGALEIGCFESGQYVDVIGESKGKGFQGVMKRHGFHGQPASHGSKMHRRNGAIGNRSTPGRVWKNMGMPGRTGGDRITVQNLEVIQVREAEQVLLISGAIPGAKGSYVVVRPAKKK